MSQVPSEQPRQSAADGLTFIDGAEFYAVNDVGSMEPFLMSIVSDGDRWMFVSSTGTLTGGRVDATGALFPLEAVGGTGFEDRVRSSQHGELPLRSSVDVARRGSVEYLTSEREPVTGGHHRRGPQAVAKGPLGGYRNTFQYRIGEHGLTSGGSCQVVAGPARAAAQIEQSSARSELQALRQVVGLLLGGVARSAVVASDDVPFGSDHRWISHDAVALPELGSQTVILRHTAILARNEVRCWRSTAAEHPEWCPAPYGFRYG